MKLSSQNIGLWKTQRLEETRVFPFDFIRIPSKSHTREDSVMYNEIIFL